MVERMSLEYFIEVCDCGSIGKAAKSLQVTPQAVSKAISGLEKKLGYSLLIRTKDGCMPTQRGLEVQRIAVRLQRVQKQALDQIYGIQQEEKSDNQDVRVGVWGSFATIMPVADYADFHTLYPSIRIHMQGYPDLSTCEKALIAGEVDLAFCGRETDGCGFTGLQEYGSTPYVIVNGNNPLASRERIRLSELAGEKLIGDNAADGRGVAFQEEMDKAGIAPVLFLPPLSDSLKRTLVMRENYVAFSYCPPGWLPYGVVPVNVTDIHNYEATCFSKAADRELSWAAQTYADYIVPRFKKDIFMV